MKNVEAEMKKLVINKCNGGFGLSEKAILRWAELKGIKVYSENEGGFMTSYYLCEPEEFHKLHLEANKTGDYSKTNDLYFCDSRIERDDPVLIQVIEELGEEANGIHAELAIVEIPEDVEYTIDEHCGVESVHETHRRWY